MQKIGWMDRLRNEEVAGT